MRIVRLSEKSRWAPNRGCLEITNGFFLPHFIAGVRTRILGRDTTVASFHTVSVGDWILRFCRALRRAVAFSPYLQESPTEAAEPADSTQDREEPQESTSRPWRRRWFGG
jgi:hypothetical protein